MATRLLGAPEFPEAQIYLRFGITSRDKGHVMARSALSSICLPNAVETPTATVRSKRFVPRGGLAAKNPARQVYFLRLRPLDPRAG